MKTVLVPATGSDGDSVAFDTALAACRLLGAHLDFLHARLDPAEIASAMVSADAGAALVSSDWLARFEGEAGRCEERARAMVGAFCAREGISLDGEAEGISAEWHRTVGREADEIVRYGQASELIVVARSGAGEGVALDTLEAALFDSGRPLLIPGKARLPAALGVVAIGWKPTREAARAVGAAMPFLAQAARVVIVTVAEEGSGDSASAARLAATLRRHRIDVGVDTVQPGTRRPVEALTEAARAHQAMLL